MKEGGRKVEGRRRSRIKYTPSTESEQEVTHLLQGLILAVPNFVVWESILEKTSSKDFNVQAA
jgi:hypothetical protein